MIEKQKYVRKPLFVDAVRVTTDNFEEIADWCQGEITSDSDVDPSKQYIKVRVHNPKNPRQTKAFVGDWLLYTERGYKVYTNKAFHASFDIVQDEITQSDAMVPAMIPKVNSVPTADVEFVAATPESIVKAIQETEAKINAEEARAVEEVRRVLSRKEQIEMDPDEIRELLRSGEAVLAQDLKE